MKTNTVVIPTNGIEGNITSCGLDTKPTGVIRKSAFSLTEQTSFQTYNLCTGEAANDYTVSGITGFGALALFIGALFIVIFALIIASHDSY